jgi:hypothetical protein
MKSRDHLFKFRKNILTLNTNSCTVPYRYRYIFYKSECKITVRQNDCAWTTCWKACQALQEFFRRWTESCWSPVCWEWRCFSPAHCQPAAGCWSGSAFRWASAVLSRQSCDQPAGQRRAGCRPHHSDPWQHGEG